MKKNVNKFHLS